MPHLQHLPSAMAALRPTTAPPSIRAGVGTWVGTQDRTAYGYTRGSRAVVGLDRLDLDPVESGRSRLDLYLGGGMILTRRDRRPARQEWRRVGQHSTAQAFEARIPPSRSGDRQRVRATWVCVHRADG